MMSQQINVALGERSYPILVGTGLLRQCDALLALAANRVVVLVSNTTVVALLSEPVSAQLSRVAAKLLHVNLPDGEQYKTLATLETILSAMLAEHADRKTLVVALGGGVVGDMAGFAAAVYQRGIDFVQMPTTLLAMVDSSVGGKTAVNHPLGKNMIGAFYQPKLVIADVDALATLPERELSAGLAEVIKHGAVLDAAYFDQVEASIDALLARDPGALAQAVAGSCRIKAAVVVADEREQGIRAFLNFGHTFGHAIEAALGYGTWLHGEAVGTGMVIAAQLSSTLGLLAEAQRERLVTLIQRARLPVQPPRIDSTRLLDLMQGDKKASQGSPTFILLEALGQGCSKKVPQAQVLEVLDTFQSRLA
jgi:3-dehydroquinate synthase